MDISPAITRVGGYDLNVPAEDTDTDEDEALCRICRSPEEPGNPLRYPCLCRGSIKYVHQDCLRLWLNRRGYKKCEVIDYITSVSNKGFEFINEICGRSYSFVPVYSENAPERLPCSEFLIGVLLRLSRYMKLIVPWTLVILFLFILFVLFPFSIGWILLTTLGGIYLSGISPLTLGYMMILSITIAYFGTLFTLRHYSFPSIVRWFSLGFYFVAVILPCLLWVFLVEACKNLFFIKNGFLLWLKIAALPWMIGWWLQICTAPLFETTISQRFEILDEFPCMMIIRWLLGIFCLVFAFDYMDLIQETIHKRAFTYLHLIDVTDQDYKITKLNLGYTFFAFASHGFLLVILTYLPIKAVTLISPSFFPLELWITDERPFIGVYSIYFKLMVSGSQWLIELSKPVMKHIVRNWIVTVSSWLQLSDFLLIVPQPGREFDDNPWFVLYSMAEGSFVISHKFRNAEEDIKDQTDNRFLPRIALMLVLAVLSLFLYSIAFMALPILVGRLFLDSVSFIRLRFGVNHDDLCAFWIGCYILRRFYISICFVSDHIQHGRIVLLLKYVLIRIRNGLFFSIWISVIPGLLGLLIDLMIIIPSRVPLNESPVYFLIQDWLIGVAVLHIWTFLTMRTRISCFATKPWRGKFERIKNEGIDRLPTMWLLRDVIGSIINTLLTTLCVPYLFVKALFPLVGFSQSINSAAERFIWPVVLALIIVWLMAKLTCDLIIYLHQLVFNERYLVGERVDNLTEDLEQGIIIHGV